MLLAGDVGGTKTLLGLFAREQQRPRAIVTRAYPTNTFSRFTDILDAFERDVQQPLRIDAAVVGVAGPVVNARANLTNISWDISAAEIATRLGSAPVQLLNDLEAMAWSIGVLAPDEVAVLQEGVARGGGSAVLIAAGTGLGEAYLPHVDGRLRPVPSEGGHADFAPQDDREIALLQHVRRTRERVDVEHILGGHGFVVLHGFTHDGASCPSVDGVAVAEQPAAISRAGLEGRCPRCTDALRMFVSAYGSEAGNLALRGVATGGVFVGGGIAPKILPALQRDGFIDAFRRKPPMTDLLSRMPVKVILNPEAALLGAAVVAASLER